MEPGSTPRPLVQKKTWRDSLPIDMLLSAVLGVAQSSSEIPEGLMNNLVFLKSMNFDQEPQISKVGNKISCLIVILAPWLVPTANRWLHA